MNPKIIHSFLELLAKTLPEGGRAVMIWDGAAETRPTGAQRAPLRVPENVTLVRLPPYCPELNPTQNLWRHLKRRFWNNRAYAD
ncbi:transposase [Pirellulimonas nuda]|nr:transposase [Pirellulimonas nuda]